MNELELMRLIDTLAEHGCAVHSELTDRERDLVWDALARRRKVAVTLTIDGGEYTCG